MGLSRASGYGTDDRYLTDPERRSYLILQIETKAGLASLESIFSAEGLDMIMVGSYDLAASMGVELWSKAHLASVKEILAAAKAPRTVHLPLHYKARTNYRVLIARRGSVSPSSDVLILAQGAAAMLGGAALS